MKLLGSMTCAGSMVLFLYLIFMAALKKSFGAKHRYRILIMALFFYMVPVQLGHYMDIAQDIVQDRAQERTLFMDQEGNRVYDMSQNVIEVTWEGKIYFPFMAAKITLFIVWSIVAVTIIFFKLSGYGKERRRLFEASEDITVKETLEALEAARTGLGIRRNIRYRWDPGLKVPLSIGVIRPILLLPKQRYSDEEGRFIYEHELLHIKNYDTLFKLLGVLVTGLNWYNPLVYWLVRELGKVSESVCDEQIALNCGEEQRKMYAQLILQMVTVESGKGFKYTAPFGSSKENVKERISLMMKTRKLKAGMRVLAVCFTALTGLAGSIPVLAYEKPVIVLDQSGENIKHGTRWEEIFVEEGFKGSEEEMNSLFVDVDAADLKELPAESYFQDMQGNIYIGEGRQEQKACSHTYVNGTQHEHEKRGDSCTIYVYNARRCSKCGNVINESLAYELKYPKCPH